MEEEREKAFDTIDITNTVNGNGQGILHKIAAGHIDFSHNQCNKLINHFLEIGCNINLQDKTGKTAMHIAVEERNVNCLDTLIACGGDVNIIDKNNETVFKFAWRRLNEGNLTSFEIGSYRLLARHINKMKIAGCWLTQENNSWYTNSLKQYNYYDHDNMTFHTRELERMRNVVLKDNVTLKDFIAKNENELMQFLTKEILVKISIILSTVNQDFPIFGNVLKMQLIKVTARQRQIHLAKIMLESLAGKTLPDLCFDNIRKNLNHTDLQNIIFASTKPEYIYFFKKDDNLINYCKFVLNIYIK